MITVMDPERVIPEAAELPVPQAEPSRQAHYWTEDRLALRSWLGRNAPTLGELYQGAVEMMYGNQIPGWTWFVCHAVREIRNRLPDAIAGPKSGSSFQSKNRLDALVQAWTAAGFSLDGSVPGSSMTEESALPASADIPLPRGLVEQIARLLQDHHAVRERPEEAATRLFEAAAPENAALRATLAPVTKNWIDTTEWFVEFVHVRNTPDAFPSEQLTLKFGGFEKALKSLVGEFFAGIGEIDAILQDANA